MAAVDVIEYKPENDKIIRKIYDDVMKDFALLSRIMSDTSRNNNNEDMEKLLSRIPLNIEQKIAVRARIHDYTEEINAYLSRVGQILGEYEGMMDFIEDNSCDNYILVAKYVGHIAGMITVSHDPNAGCVITRDDEESDHYYIIMRSIMNAPLYFVAKIFNIGLPRISDALIPKVKEMATNIDVSLVVAEPFDNMKRILTKYHEFQDLNKSDYDLRCMYYSDCTIDPSGINVVYML